MSNKILTFKDVYQLPLKIDEFCPIYVFSSNRVMTFNIITEDLETVREVLSVINGEKEKLYDDVEYVDEYIFVNGKPIFLIRGWGYLTGVGGFNLSPNKAAKIQDDFGKFIVYRLKGNSL